MLVAVAFFFLLSFFRVGAAIGSAFDAAILYSAFHHRNSVNEQQKNRREKIVEIIKDSQGFGWVVSDEEIANAIKLVKEKTDIDISPNSALSIAGLQKAIKNNWKLDGKVVCLITGK